MALPKTEDTMETIEVIAAEVEAGEVTKAIINLLLRDNLGTKGNDAWPNTGR